MTLPQKYQKSKDRRTLLRLKTRHPDGDAYNGVVVEIKRSFIVLREVYSFEFDGLIVFPKKFLKGYRDGKFEQCGTKILKNNGQLDRLESPSWLASCTDISNVLDELMHRDIWPAVEVLFNDGNDSALYLGPIVYVNEDVLCLHAFSADGEWEKTYEISHHEIFRIEFDDKYCNHFSSLMRAKEDTSEIVETLRRIFGRLE